MENETKELNDALMEAIRDTGDFTRRNATRFLEKCLIVEKISGIHSEDYLEGFGRAITLLKELTDEVQERYNEER